MKHKVILTLIIVAIALQLLFLWESKLVVITPLITLLCFLFILIIGSSLIQLNYFVRSINSGEKKGIAITFDDGPDPNVTPRLLEILSKEGVKATFFMIGSKVEKHPNIVKKVYNEGHTIGNHSTSHKKEITFYSTRKLQQDIDVCSNSIKTEIGKRPIFFRPPYGVTTPRYDRALRELNMKSIGWNVRSLDTKIKEVDLLFNRVKKRITNGSILLFHDTQEVTVEVLPRIIQYCKNNGIKIAPLPELINEKEYA